jgi:hypothetical protein
MIGRCQKITLSGGFDRVRASSNDANSGVNSIRFYRGNSKKTYGKIDDDFTEWNFTEDKPLVGFYGRQSDRGIEQLGFITLDSSECLSSDVGSEECFGTDCPIETDGSDDKKRQVDVLPFGLNSITILVIALLIVALIVYTVVSIYACMTKKAENQITPTIDLPVKTPVSKVIDKPEEVEMQPAAPAMEFKITISPAGADQTAVQNNG